MFMQIEYMYTKHVDIIVGKFRCEDEIMALEYTQYVDT